MLEPEDHEWGRAHVHAAASLKQRRKYESCCGGSGSGWRRTRRHGRGDASGCTSIAVPAGVRAAEQAARSRKRRRRARRGRPSVWAAALSAGGAGAVAAAGAEGGGGMQAAADGPGWERRSRAEAEVVSMKEGRGAAAVPLRAGPG